MDIRWGLVNYPAQVPYTMFFFGFSLWVAENLRKLSRRKWKSEIGFKVEKVVKEWEENKIVPIYGNLEFCR